MEAAFETSNEEEHLISKSERGGTSTERGYDSLAHHIEDPEDYPESNLIFNEEETSQKLPQYAAAFSATMTAFGAGIVLGWTSPITTELENGEYNDITISTEQMGWIGSLSTLGALLMCIPTGFLCDAIGRRTTLLSLVAPFTIGWALLVLATNIQMLYAGRFLTGLAAGACCIAAPLYTSEIAQKEIRGTLGSYFQLMVTVGIFYAYAVGKILSPVRYTFSCSVIPIVAFGALIFQPETPLHLLKTDRIDKARQALVRLRGPTYNIDPEFNSLESGLRDSNDSYATFMSTLREKATRRAFIIAFGLMFFQQFCGINAVIFYTSNIFESSGIKFNPKSATILVGAFQVVATFISSLIVDRLGRKKLLLFSALVMAFSTLLIGLFYTLKERDIINGNNISSYGVLPVLSLSLFVVVFSLGFGPIPWLISAEIFTPEIKSLASALAGTLNWFLAFLITKFYLDIADGMGTDNTFYLFTGFSLAAIVFVRYVVVETKGKTIGQIQTELGE